MVQRAAGQRLKRRSDLLRHSQRYPGALGALFLTQVRGKLLAGDPGRVKDLHKTDPTVWAATRKGLKEIRDLREVQVLSKMLAELNADRIPQAVDFAAQRIKEILHAKRPSSSWEKAAVVSLMPTEQATMASSLPDGAAEL